MYLLAPSFCKIKKNFLEPILSYENVIFGPKMAHLSRTTFFWYKALLLLSSNFWPFLLRKIFKKILKADLEL